MDICAHTHVAKTDAMDSIDVLQAEVLKTLASPRRLQIIHLLADGPCDVGRLAEELGISQPNASQHLAVMRSVGIVESERVGRGVVYRLVDPDVVRACAIMRGVLLRRISRLSQLSDRATAGAVGSPETNMA